MNCVQVAPKAAATTSSLESAWLICRQGSGHTTDKSAVGEEEEDVVSSKHKHGSDDKKGMKKMKSRTVTAAAVSCQQRQPK